MQHHTKRVSTRMVTHIWANGGVREHHNSNKSVWTDGRCLYSYNRLIGYRGREGFFVNADSYSPTTSKHKGLMFAAMRGNVVAFRVKAMDDIAWLFRADSVSESDKKMIENFVVRNNQDCESDAVSALLREFGITPARIAVLQRKRERIDKAKAKSEIQSNRRELQHFLKTNPSRVRSILVRYAMSHNEQVISSARTMNKTGLRLLKFANAQGTYSKKTIDRIRAIRRAIQQVIDNSHRVEQRAMLLNNARLSVNIIKRCDRILFGKDEDDKKLREKFDCGLFPHTSDNAHWLPVMTSNPNSNKDNNVELAYLAKHRAINNLLQTPFASARFIDKAEQWLNEHANTYETINRLREERYNEFEKEQQRREENRRAEILREQRHKLDLWLDGSSNFLPNGVTDMKGGSFVRINGDYLETSGGAVVPLDHAIKAFRRVLMCKKRGIYWTKNGDNIRVGHFQIDEIKPNGDFVAGCHKFTFETVSPVAASIGVV